MLFKSKGSLSKWARSSFEGSLGLSWFAVNFGMGFNQHSSNLFNIRSEFFFLRQARFRFGSGLDIDKTNKGAIQETFDFNASKGHLDVHDRFGGPLQKEKIAGGNQ